MGEIDGSLRFDTKIDTEGFKQGLSGLEGFASSGANAVKSALDSLSQSMNQVGSNASKTGADISSSMAKTAESAMRSSDPQQLCTRLYALGYGEGVNQLTIKEDVNNGLPYLQSPPEIINKYGIIQNVWIDRRYENPESFKEAAQAMLNELQEPLREYSVGYAQVGKGEFENAEIGKIVELIDPDTRIREKTYITGITTIYGDIKDSTLTIASKPKDIATSVADLADRQRIEMTYAQGATQLFAKSLQVNADTRDGAKFNFFIPAEMRVINKVLAKSGWNRSARTAKPVPATAAGI